MSYVVAQSPYPPPQVQYYGLIKQSTGEDWENTNVSLSTAQPSIGGSAPSLPTRLIRFKRPVRRIQFRKEVNTLRQTEALHLMPIGGQERFRAISSAPARRMSLEEGASSGEEVCLYGRSLPAMDIAVAKVRLH